MNRTIISLLFVGAISSIATPVASGAPTTVPSGLNPGDQYRLAFVTSQARNGTSTNIADYNAFVTTVANSVPELAALGTNWAAIASTATVNARQNTGTDVGPGVPIYTVADTLIAASNTTLWSGTLVNPLEFTENGALITTLIWTGSDQTGNPIAGLELGSSGGGAEVGDSGQVDSRWMSRTTNATFKLAPFYAMSGVLTVVPEPSTLALAALGLIALAAYRWRKR